MRLSIQVRFRQVNLILLYTSPFIRLVERVSLLNGPMLNDLLYQGTRLQHLSSVACQSNSIVGYVMSILLIVQCLKRVAHLSLSLTRLVQDIEVTRFTSLHMHV